MYTFWQGSVNLTLMYVSHMIICLREKRKKKERERERETEREREREQERESCDTTLINAVFYTAVFVYV